MDKIWIKRTTLRHSLSYKTVLSSDKHALKKNCFDDPDKPGEHIACCACISVQYDLLCLVAVGGFECAARMTLLWSPGALDWLTSGNFFNSRVSHEHVLRRDLKKQRLQQKIFLKTFNFFYLRVTKDIYVSTALRKCAFI